MCIRDSSKSGSTFTSSSRRFGRRRFECASRFFSFFLRFSLVFFRLFSLRLRLFLPPLLLFFRLFDKEDEEDEEEEDKEEENDDMDDVVEVKESEDSDSESYRSRFLFFSFILMRWREAKFIKRSNEQTRALRRTKKRAKERRKILQFLHKNFIFQRRKHARLSSVRTFTATIESSSKASSAICWD